jgi:adenosylhomocysteine nucleosidase
MPAPTLHEINERRLDAEARRRGATVDETRELILQRGLAYEEQERARKQREQELAADLILLTTGMTEFRELRATAQTLQYPFTPRRSAVQEYHHLGLINKNAVATARVGSMGAFNALFTSLQAHVDTGATTLILIGTAFGVDRSTQRIGDVLIGRSVQPYDRCRAIENDGECRLEPGDNTLVHASDDKTQRFERAAKLLTDAGEIASRVSSGALLSGSVLIESVRYRDDLLARFSHVEPRVVGGEMEADGVVAVCARQRLNWILIKGVCDFADASSRGAPLEQARSIAARNAAEFVLRALAISPRPKRRGV